MTMYPLEVPIESGGSERGGRLYISSVQQACSAVALRCCKIDAFVNCCEPIEDVAVANAFEGKRILTLKLKTARVMSESEVDEVSAAIKLAIRFIG